VRELQPEAPEYPLTEIYTERYIVRGEVFTPTRVRLADILNQLEDPILTLLNAKIYRIGESNILQESPSAQVTKRLICFVIPREETERTAPVEIEHRAAYVPKIPHPVLVNVSSFELKGKLHLIQEISVRDALSSFRLPFFALTDVEIFYVPQRLTLPAEKVVLVSKDQVRYFTPI